MVSLPSWTYPPTLFFRLQELGTSNVVRTGVAAGDMKSAVEAVAAGGGLSAVASEEDGGKKREGDGATGGVGEGKDNDDDDDAPPRECPQFIGLPPREYRSARRLPFA